MTFFLLKIFMYSERVMTFWALFLLEYSYILNNDGDELYTHLIFVKKFLFLNYVLALKQKSAIYDNFAVTRQERGFVACFCHTRCQIHNLAESLTVD